LQHIYRFCREHRLNAQSFKKLSSPKRAVLLQLLSSRRLQRSWVFDIFCQKMNGNVSREFKKCSQLVISAHNEPLSIVAMRVSNPDGSSVRIHGCDTAPTPPGLTEVVRNCLPVPHGMNSASFALYTAITK
jgi:hypothetical protein